MRIAASLADRATAQAGYHPADFLSWHPIAAYSQEVSCASCHNSSQFCQTCHQQSGIVAAAVLGTKANFHDAKGAFLLGHGQAARQSLELRLLSRRARLPHFPFRARGPRLQPPRSGLRRRAAAEAELADVLGLSRRGHSDGAVRHSGRHARLRAREQLLERVHSLPCEPARFRGAHRPFDFHAPEIQGPDQLGHGVGKRGPGLRHSSELA